jgi:hypothetical protein
MSLPLRALRALCPSDHVYKAALYPEPTQLEAYTAEGEWAGHGYTAGGAVLSGHRIEMDGDEAVLRFNTVEWLDADVQARTILVYDATTGDAINATQLERTAGVFGGLFEFKMPDEGIARIG